MRRRASTSLIEVLKFLPIHCDAANGCPAKSIIEAPAPPSSMQLRRTDSATDFAAASIANASRPSA